MGLRSIDDRRWKTFAGSRAVEGGFPRLDPEVTSTKFGRRRRPSRRALSAALVIDEHECTARVVPKKGAEARHVSCVVRRNVDVGACNRRWRCGDLRGENVDRHLDASVGRPHDRRGRPSFDWLASLAEQRDLEAGIPSRAREHRLVDRGTCPESIDGDDPKHGAAGDDGVARIAEAPDDDAVEWADERLA